MSPNHPLADLASTDRLAVLSRGGELHFLVHPVAADPEEVRAAAKREGAEGLRTHLHDRGEILGIVAGREWDIGGEG